MKAPSRPDRRVGLLRGSVPRGATDHPPADRRFRRGRASRGRADRRQGLVRFTTICGNVAEDVRCRICADPRRDQHAVCVVEEPKDVVAIRADPPGVQRRYPSSAARSARSTGIGPSTAHRRRADVSPRCREITRSSSRRIPISRARPRRPIRPPTAALRSHRHAARVRSAGRRRSGYADGSPLGRAFEGRRLIDA